MTSKCRPKYTLGLGLFESRRNVYDVVNLHSVYYKLNSALDFFCGIEKKIDNVS